jgi:alanyl-tRNA synthetase
MISKKLRDTFIRFFKERSHRHINSSPVVPHDDPTLLFNNAGMNQFKDVFLGKSERDYSKAVTAQKCIRVGGKHNDLDNVGHTSRHLTFFEMLGNFSFGDYFKEEAISYAWELSTKGFEFPEEKIWITVFEKDDEAFELWKKWVPEKRIVRLGEKDNFWAMGETGPCGPCSELYFDRGKSYGQATSPLEDTTGERYLEFWNLVFMQFNRFSSGKLEPLAKKSIDTGAGLERLVSLKKEVDSLFETDILRELIAQVEEVSGKSYQTNSDLKVAFHVIADHIRSLSFAIADGAQPSNTDRGYVLRKLVRRAVRYGKMLDLQEPFLAQIFPRLLQTMGQDYPELKEASQHIGSLLTLEEENFLRTLKRGGNILNRIIEKAKNSPLHQISGEEAFQLKDTYGFPLEEILLLAKDSGLQVNIESYQLLEEKAKELSRSAQTAHEQLVEDNLFKKRLQSQGPSIFLGYTQNESKSRITALIREGQFVEELREGEEGLIILDQTPFYAEKGGQIGDLGSLQEGLNRFEVQSTQTPYPDIIAHVGKVQKGIFRRDQKVLATIDLHRRLNTARHHTATHLLHLALQQILGSHIRQAGSLVEPGRLRLDFNHPQALTLDEIDRIEDSVNEKIRENLSVSIYNLSYEEAQKKKEIKQFFADKYGSLVRVVDIGPSKELCGGTHVTSLGEIGLFRIIKESGIAAGVRRIEACTGSFAEQFARDNERKGMLAADLLKTSLTLLPEKMQEWMEEHKKLALKLKNVKKSLLKNMAQEMGQKIEMLQSIHFLAAVAPVPSEDLALLADELVSLFPNLVLILGLEGAKPQLLVRVAPEIIAKGVQANHLIQTIAPCIGGQGGGRAESAVAGGKNPQGLGEAFKQGRNYLLKYL